MRSFCVSLELAGSFAVGGLVARGGTAELQQQQQQQQEQQWAAEHTEGGVKGKHLASEWTPPLENNRVNCQWELVHSTANARFYSCCCADCQPEMKARALTPADWSLGKAMDI
jgi:hypothetical protein